MSSYVGLSPKNPNKYVGPNVYLSSVVTRNREPTGADYRQPETGKLYPTSSFWLIGENPTTGVQGDLWYLSKIVSNIGYWVKLSAGGTAAAINIQVDAFTTPGTDPVVPDAGNTIVITGNQVAAGDIGANVIRTNSLAVNTFTIEIQRASAESVSSIIANGVSHFNDAQFTVDSNGFVSMVGAPTPPVQSNRVDAISGSGTNPVLPDSNGEIRVEGVLVAAGTNPIRTVSTLASEYEIQVQTSQALAAADSTKIGLSNYYSNDFTVDSSGFVALRGSASVIGVKNIGFTYNSGTGTFTVHASDGTALSATNPGVVTLQSKATPGDLVTISVTANQDFIDDNGSSQIVGNLFGLTAGTATTGSDIPFFLYAVSDDTQTSIQFMISRYPNSKLSPVAAKIGVPSNPVADSQGSFFSFDNITVANYDQNPCLSCGSFRMRMSAANDWTVQTILNTDGIGCFQEGIQFSMPLGQFGNAASKYFLNNGGTAPTFTNQNLAYYILMTNQFDYWFAGNGASTAGVGAVQLRQGLPYNYIDIGSQGSGVSIFAGGYSVLIPNSVATSSNQIYIVYTNASLTGVFNNADIVLTMDLLWNGRMTILFS